MNSQIKYIKKEIADLENEKVEYIKQYEIKYSKLRHKLFVAKDYKLDREDVETKIIENDVITIGEFLLFLSELGDNLDGQGFNKLDAKFMHSLANTYKSTDHLSDKQMQHAVKNLLKYSNQILQKVNNEINDNKDLIIECLSSEITEEIYLEFCSKIEHTKLLGIFTDTIGIY